MLRPLDLFTKEFNIWHKRIITDSILPKGNFQRSHAKVELLRLKLKHQVPRLYFQHPNLNRTYPLHVVDCIESASGDLYEYD